MANKRLVKIVVVLALIIQISCQPPDFEFESLFNRKTYIKSAVFLFHPERNCSGTILHKWWVLTAAQCVYGLDQIRLFAGSGVIAERLLDGTRDLPKKMQVRTAVEAYPHHGYREGVLSKFDLALIKVDKPFDLGKTVAAVNLSAVSWPNEPNFSRNCISWGFGDIKPGKTWRSDILFKTWNSTAMHNRSPNACRCAERFQRRRLVCLKQVDGINLCGGDAGSSLLCPTDSGELAVFGIAHMTMYKHMCGFEQPPGPGCQPLPVDNVYMYTCPFNNWVSYRVPDMPLAPATCTASALIISPATLLICNRFI